MVRALLPCLMAAALGATAAFAAVPSVCVTDGAAELAERAPAAVEQYFRTLGQAPFDMRVACARWAGTFSRRHQALAERKPAGAIAAPRFILFPGDGFDVRRLSVWLSRSAHVRTVERTQRFVVAELERRVTPGQLGEFLDSPQIGYYEPDCDGPDFLTTSIDLPAVADIATAACRARRMRDMGVGLTD